MRPCIINYKGSEYIAYVSVPKDLTEVKTKALFNLTKRQLICFGSGAAIGVPLFFLCKSFLNVSAAALTMIFVLLPFMLLAKAFNNKVDFPAPQSPQSIYPFPFALK